MSIGLMFMRLFFVWPRPGSREREGKMLDKKSRQVLHRAAEVVRTQMLWASSLKGYDFWEKVWRELERASKTGEP